MGHIKGITSESSHLYASAVREVDRRLHGIEEEKVDKGAADILNRAFFIVTVGILHQDGKISPYCKYKIFTFRL